MKTAINKAGKTCTDNMNEIKSRLNGVKFSNFKIFRKMKTYIIFILVLLSTPSISQTINYVHYGFPLPITNISERNKIIVYHFHNMGDGRYDASPDLDKLIELLNSNSELMFHIYINIFGWPNRTCVRYSEYLCSNLEKKLTNGCNHSNYKIFAKGNRNPIFLYDNHPREYRLFNDRIDIMVAGKEQNKLDFLSDTISVKDVTVDIHNKILLANDKAISCLADSA
ncbi:MAG: hypothetical protein LBT56_04485, partial [Prevotellaceae bacterium]|nr:hypothetical protein [Prevotellaceae bacterium]